MHSLGQYLIPYIFSNVVFGLTILAAWKRPMWARIFLTVAFLGAGILNATTAINTPDVYLQYGQMALVKPYRDFIYGFFSEHISPLVLLIALGQFSISLGLILNKMWMRAACVAGILFGLGIACLGVGSAFPATVLMSFAFFILLKKQGHDFIWKWNQYGPGTAHRSPTSI